MGSSFAAGPGVTQSADAPPTRCSRSADNYAHQLARKRNLRLIDVSCGGATIAHVLGPWRELAPQVDALTSDTRLVTVTIGGNDLRYIGGLYAESCTVVDAPLCRSRTVSDPQARSQALSPPTEAEWGKVEAGLEEIAREVRRRSPAARLVFVDYLTVAPEHGLCRQTPLSEQAAARARDTAKRLAQLTAVVARRTAADLLKASELSRGHDPCSKDPWTTGFIAPSGAERFAPYHPNLEGMTAVANGLDRKLDR
jgi:hypothetical protein